MMKASARGDIGPLLAVPIRVHAPSSKRRIIARLLRRAPASSSRRLPRSRRSASEAAAYSFSSKLGSSCLSPREMERAL